MAELSRDDVAEVLGRVGDAIAAEIVATGIGKDELKVARDRVVRDRKSRTPGPPLKPGAFARSSTFSSDRTGCGARPAPTSNRRELLWRPGRRRGSAGMTNRRRYAGFR